MVLSEVVGGVAAGSEFISWGQLVVLATMLFSIITSTGWLTRQIDRKLNIVDFEKRYNETRIMTQKHEIRISLLEERYNNVVRILERNGIKDNKEKH